jgi:hypothetical protein
MAAQGSGRRSEMPIRPRAPESAPQGVAREPSEAPIATSAFDISARAWWRSRQQGAPATSESQPKLSGGRVDGRRPVDPKQLPSGCTHDEIAAGVDASPGPIMLPPGRRIASGRRMRGRRQAGKQQDGVSCAAERPQVSDPGAVQHAAAIQRTGRVITAVPQPHARRRFGLSPRGNAACQPRAAQLSGSEPSGMPSNSAVER